MQAEGETDGDGRPLPSSLVPRPSAIGHRPFLRIAVCSSLFHPVEGGAETRMLHLCERWARVGHRVTVFTRPQPGCAREETVAGVRIRRLIRTVDFGPLFGLSFVRSLRAALVRHADEWDVALTAQAPWEAYGTALAKRRLGKPTAVLLATSGPFGDLARIGRTRGSRWLRRLFLRNDRFLCLSDHAAEEARAFGCPPGSVVRVTYPVDLDRFRPPREPTPERSRTVVAVGRLAEQKNPLGLLEAWRGLAPLVYRHGWTLRLVGDGPLRPAAESFVAEHSLPNVEILGRREDVPELLASSAVFASATRGEGCCNALLEAMAAGLCPVTADIGGNRGVFPAGAGVLVAPDDAAALAAALAGRLDDPVGTAAKGRACRRHAEAHHALPTVAADYLRVLRRLPPTIP